LSETPVSSETTEDRTTPLRRPDSSRDPGLDPSRDRDHPELRPLLAADSDATIVLPRAGAARVAARGSKAALAAPLKPGVSLHEYRVDGVLGEGGFGITYRATDVHLNAGVAIKEYLPQDIVFRTADGTVSPISSDHLARYKQGLDSFLVEARTLASFRHRSILRVARFFEANRTAYMVLEVEEGEPLKSWWPQHKHIGEKALVELLLPLLDGLAAVHAAGFLHRDIKPDNIQVRAADGSLVLLDFGSAGQASGLASEGLTVVTPGYAPIEQYGLGEQGPWTDIYALGATLYWAVSGRKPPDAETRQADPRAYSRAVEAGRDVYGDAFLKAIDWALNTDPNKRPRNVAEFQRALCADHPAAVERFETASRRAQLRQAAGDAAAEPEAARERRRSRTERNWWQPAQWPLVLKLAAGMLLAAVLPMLVVSWLNLRGGVDTLVDAEARYLQQQAGRAATQVGDYLADARRLARGLAADPALSSFLQKPTEPQRALLRERLRLPVQAGAGVQQVLLLDAAGAAQVGSDATATGTSLALRPYFTSALSGRGYTGGLLAGSTPGSTVLHVSEPVKSDSGAVLGVLALRLSGEAVVRALEGAQQDARLTPFVLDADGVIVQHPHADLRFRSLLALPEGKQAEIRADQRFRQDAVASVNEASLARALQGADKPGQVRYDSAVSGRATVAAFAPVPGHDWSVVVAADRSALVAPLNWMQAWLLGGTLLAGLLVAAVAWWVARGITRPLRALQTAMQDLRAGDFEDARLKPRGGLELAQAARAFNALSEELKQRALIEKPVEKATDKPSA
jgi:serine/threonine protein kinase/HAMP domain-containing protein